MLAEHPELIGTLTAIGALIFIAIRQVIMWRLLDRTTNHLPWIAITLCGLVFAVSRAVHLSSPAPDVAMAMVRVQFAISMFLPGLALATVEAVSELPISRSTKWAIVGAIPFQLVCTLTPWLIHGPLEAHVDLLGHVHLGAHSGFMVALLVPVCVWLGITMRARVRAMPPAIVKLRRNFRFGLVVFIVLGLHDALMGAGVFRSIFIYEYAFVVFGVVAANFEARRNSSLRHELEQLVENKREKLETAQRRLERSQQRYQQLANATREGVVLCNAARVLDINRAFCELLGAAERDLLGADLRDLVTASDRRAVDRLLLADVGPIEVPLQRPDGKSVVVSLQAMPPPKGSAGTRVLLVRDVSGERELQSRLAVADRLAAVGTLAAGTAHEINNPLTFVLANTEMLAEEIANARTLDPAVAASWQELCADATAGAERIRRVVQDLMSLARDRQGDEADIAIAQTLDRCVAMANPHIRHRARVVRDYAATRTVRASEGRLFQVFLNLIVNAAQAIPEGHLPANEIRLSTRDAGDRIIIEVRDSGVGMDKAVLAKIFTPFFTTKEIGHGTGLGLSISHGIVTSLGGTIEVDSEPGKGTTFRVTLPVCAPVGDVAPRMHVVEDGPAPLRVLVIDDETRIAQGIARMLRGQGHDVHIAHSGRVAFEKLQQTHFDVALCDLMMPDVTGMELFAKLVSEGHEIVNRMVFMTGGAFSQQAQEFLDRVGSERWLSKPIPMAELRKIVLDVGAPGN